MILGLNKVFVSITVKNKDKVLSTVLSIAIAVVIIGGLLALSVHNSLSKGGWGNWSN